MESHTQSGHTPSLLAGGDLHPTAYNPDNPLLLIIIQLFIIVGLSRILAYPLSRYGRQPRVLSEILAGVLLGPTAMGRIPGFTANIFPPESIPSLNLLAQLGLVLYLFTIGLEVDFGLFKRNLKPCLSVSIAGIAIPFGLGCALSVGLYKQFIDPEIRFTNFMIFIGTSSSITAFPVLARILTELRLMGDNVGVVVLASGVFNDVLGWILLALSVALTASSQGQVVIYIILSAAGVVLALWFIARPAFNLLGRRTGSYENGPTQTYICATLILVLATAWIMEQIGISAILAAFVVGLVLPGPLGDKITERIEDVVISIFVPLYFATSGLKTDLGLLNSGIIWGWVGAVMAVAFCGKFFGCATAAKLCGFSWRESGAVGSLMAAKGLIELVVLNIGLQVGVINRTVFSIFVLEALVLTFAATPLTLAFYPPELRHAAMPSTSELALKKRRASKDDGEPSARSRTRFTVVLERFDHLHPLFLFSRLVSTPPTLTPASSSPQSAAGDPDATVTSSTIEEKATAASDGVSFDTLRLVELSDRTSSVFSSADTDDLLRKDPLTALYTTFASLNGLSLSSSALVVAEQHLFAETVATRAAHNESDFVLIPWRLAKPSEEGVMAAYIPNPFESLFGKPAESAHTAYTSFVRDLYASAPCDVGLFVDRGRPPPSDVLPGHYELFLPFHGGSDDRACLELLLQLAKNNRGVRVTVLIVTRAPEPTEEDKQFDGQVSKIDSSGEESQDASSASPPLASPASPTQALEFTLHGTHQGGHGTIYPTQHDLESETADTIALDHARASTSPTTTTTDSVTFVDISTSRPLRTVIRRAAAHAAARKTSRFTWVVGRGRRDAASHRQEGLELLREAEQERRLGVCAAAEARRCLGEGGVAALLSGVGENVLVVQSRATGGRRSGGPAGLSA